MPDLLIRHVDDLLVQALRDRAAAHGRSTEAESRAILAQALGPALRRPTFADGLFRRPDRPEDDAALPRASLSSTRFFD